MMYKYCWYGTDLRQVYQGGDILRVILAGPRHLVVKGGQRGRLMVVPIEEGQSRVLAVPFPNLDQEMSGISLRSGNR